MSLFTTNDVANEDSRLPGDARPGRVRLRVADLGRALGFYEGVLGLRRTEEEGGFVGLAPEGGRPVLSLEEVPGVLPADRVRTAGLYHYALLVPDGAELGGVLTGLRERGWPLHGASDHAVSEALYLADPDGNGIEIYADRPREDWRWADGQVRMTTAPLDLVDLAERARGEPGWEGLSAGTVLGHVHLHVGDLARAEAFYSGVIGFDVVQRGFPGALFLSAGGYHHHLGLNVWAGEGLPPPSPGVAGLIDWELILPSRTDLDRLVERLQASGAGVSGSDRLWRTEDPDGIGLTLTAPGDPMPG